MESVGVATGRRGTIGQHVVTDVPKATPLDLVEDVVARVRGRHFATVCAVAVLAGGEGDDGETLAGVVAIEDLLAASSDAHMGEMMDSNPPTVELTAGQEPAAWRAVEHGGAVLAVVDGGRRFLGIVPASALVTILHAEHDEDLARLGGFGGTAASARAASLESVPRRLRHRLPWLVIGLAGALLAAGIVGGFEETLRQQVLIAYFLPGVVYLADAVGTQTEALVIRGLSLGVSIRSVVRRELMSGVVLGLLLGAVALVFVAALWGDTGVALAVALSVVAASSIATIVALLLPWLFHHFGLDPAFGSGPLATVVQDVLTVAIYFVIAAQVAV